MTEECHCCTILWNSYTVKFPVKTVYGTMQEWCWSQHYQQHNAIWLVKLFFLGLKNKHVAGKEVTRGTSTRWQSARGLPSPSPPVWLSQVISEPHICYIHCAPSHSIFCFTTYNYGNRTDHMLCWTALCQPILSPYSLRSTNARTLSWVMSFYVFSYIHIKALDYTQVLPMC